jgi:hypothetical protein
LLESLFAAPDDCLRLAPLVAGTVLEAVRKLRLEGLIGKRIDSTYEPGERSGAWIRRENALGYSEAGLQDRFRRNGLTSGNFVAMIKSLRRSFADSVNSGFF